jgi:hypothetical protein
VHYAYIHSEWLGYLTQKGLKKRKAEVLLKLLDVDFKNGELTEKAYQNKKRKVELELEESVKVGAASSSPGASSGQQVARSLAEFTQNQKMSETIAKLFNVTSSVAPSKKSKGKSSVGGKKKSTKVAGARPLQPLLSQPIEKNVVCLPVSNLEIPIHNAILEVLKNVGFIETLYFNESDSEDLIREKIHQLFPKIFQGQLGSSKKTSISDYHGKR